MRSRALLEARRQAAGGEADRPFLEMVPSRRQGKWCPVVEVRLRLPWRKLCPIVEVRLRLPWSKTRPIEIPDRNKVTLRQRLRDEISIAPSHRSDSGFGKQRQFGREVAASITIANCSHRTRGWTRRSSGSSGRRKQPLARTDNRPRPGEDPDRVCDEPRCVLAGARTTAGPRSRSSRTRSGSE